MVGSYFYPVGMFDGRQVVHGLWTIAYDIRVPAGRLM